MLQAVGKAYQALSEYSCRKAIELFHDLPQHQMNTGWVLSQIGRAHFELQEYHEVRKLINAKHDLVNFNMKDEKILEYIQKYSYF